MVKPLLFSYNLFSSLRYIYSLSSSCITSSLLKPVQAIMKMVGMDVGAVRTPLTGVDEGQYEALKKDLEEIGFFQW